MRMHFSARYVDTTILSYLCFDYAQLYSSSFQRVGRMCVKNCIAPFYWIRLAKTGLFASRVEQASTSAMMCRTGRFSHEINCMRMIWARPCFVVQLGSLPRYDGTQGDATSVPTKICLQHVIHAPANAHKSHHCVCCRCYSSRRVRRRRRRRQRRITLAHISRHINWGCLIDLWPSAAFTYALVRRRRCV